ncbi:DUF6843 domain-containing protein [Priestia megaterium]|uniref:DUF6843 domain-containing protein n=1 Tax=Priestia megaterium TaxID=1404 RepID=UPI0011BAEE6A|nr:hypothetical protein [Priestia megaterium]QDZ81096.1 hypothetical protein D0440_17135 [Priestia megaterium]
MKKIGYIFLGLLLLVGTIYFLFFHERRGMDTVYLIPNDYKGCVGVFYNVKGKSPLKVQNDKVIHKISRDGKLETSSPQSFGWYSTEDSGWHNSEYYYVNNQGKKVKKLNSERDINWEMTAKDDYNGQYFTFFVGGNDDANTPQPECFSQ